MTAFLSYAESPTGGQLGHIAASSNGSLGRTQVRATDAVINCGLAVCNGATAGKTCKAPTTAAEAAASLGVLLDPVYLNEIGQVATSYDAGQPATICEEGYVWVNAEGTVAESDPVFVRHTSDGGSNTTRGTFTNKSDYPSSPLGALFTPGSYAAAVRIVTITLTNGTVTESFAFTTDASPTAAEVATGLAALINASSNFDAVDNGGTFSVSSSTNIVEMVASDNIAISGSRCARLKGAKWASARTGAGLAKIRLQLRQD